MTICHESRLAAAALRTFEALGEKATTRCSLIDSVFSDRWRVCLTPAFAVPIAFATAVRNSNDAMAAANIEVKRTRNPPESTFSNLQIVPTKNSEGVEKSGDLFPSAVVSPACIHCSRNSSHGSAFGFAAA
jgi:hypothetical protein